MDNLNHQNLPDQKGYKIDIEKFRENTEKQINHFDWSDSKTPLPDRAGFLFSSNDFNVSLLEGEPGSKIPVHTHTPDFYQIIIPLQGTAKITYKDNSGESHTTKTSDDELVFLPPGAQNSIEMLGDKRVILLNISKETSVLQVEHLFDHDPDTNLKEDINEYLTIDTLRGEVLNVDRDVVTDF